MEVKLNYQLDFHQIENLIILLLLVSLIFSNVDNLSILVKLLP